MRYFAARCLAFRTYPKSPSTVFGGGGLLVLGWALIVVASAICGCADSSGEESPPVADAVSPDSQIVSPGSQIVSPESQQAPHIQESVRGRVVWLAEVLRRRYGIESDPDVAEVTVALETDDGRVLPLVKDDRGRGFWMDERLRGIPVELYVRRYEGSPLAQVIRVYTLKGDKKYRFDYWCETCAIPMFELKECECCQGPIEFRERLVKESSAAGVVEGLSPTEGAATTAQRTPEAESVGVTP